MLSRFVALTQALGLLSGFLLLVTSPPARRAVRAIRRSERILGPATFTSTILVLGILSLGLLSGALEPRLSGPSPFVSLPVVGRFLAPLARGQRVAILLICLSVVTLLWNLLVRMPSVRAIRPDRRGLTLPLWLGWLAASVLSTWFARPSLEAQELMLYAAVVISVLAVIVTVPLIDRGIAVRCLTILFVVAAAATYSSGRLSHDWAWTTDWPGGFRPGERLQGIFPQPNVTGVFFGLGVLVVASRADMRLWSRLVLAAPMVLLVFWSGSRGAVLLLLAGGLALTWARGKISRLRHLALISMAVSVVLPILNLSTTTGLFKGRAITWRTAYEIGQSFPLLGGGSFPLQSPSGASSAIYAHNQLLQSFAESGILGVLVLAAALLLALRPDTVRFPLAGAALVGMMATLPYENPMRLFAPSFAASLVILLVLIGSGEEALTDLASRPRATARRIVAGVRR